MALYPKQSLQMLVDLINEANPGLPVALTTTNMMFGAPSAITPSGGKNQNTSIRVTAAARTKYTGNATLTYRRLDFGTLFRGLPIVVYQYSPVPAGQSPFRISDLLAAINQKYGLNLSAADVIDGYLPSGTLNAVPGIGLPAGTRNASIAVTARPTSFGYTGSFTLYWVRGLPDLAAIVTVLNLPGFEAVTGSGGALPLSQVCSVVNLPGFDAVV